MFRQHLGQHFLVTADDIDHATGQVRSIQDLVKIRGQQRVMPGRHNHDPVAHGDGRHHRGDKTEQAGFFRGDDADHAQWLFHGQSYVAERGSMNLAVIFV